jgi:hypothetical protein
MATCVQCKAPFSAWNPAARHFRKRTCGACGSLVCTGCAVRGTSSTGHDVLRCRKCHHAGADAAPDTLFGKVGSTVSPAMAARASAVGAAFLAEASAALDASKDDAEQRLRQVLGDTVQDLDSRAGALVTQAVAQLDKALKDRARREFRSYLWLLVILTSAAAVSGAVSLLFAWLHRGMTVHP